MKGTGHDYFGRSCGPRNPVKISWSASVAGSPGVSATSTVTGPSTTANVLFRNEGDGTFSDITSLLGFPIERWRLLVAKNLAALAFRAPGLLTVLLVGLVSPPALLPAAFAILVGTFLIAAGIDNFATILFPITVPEPGRNPYGHASGGRGLGVAIVSMFLLAGAALLSGPFALLAWLPLLLGAPLLWIVTLPLSLAGAAATYAMLVAAAARLLRKREPELIARILGEA